MTAIHVGVVAERARCCLLKGMAQATCYSAGHPNGCSFCEAINTVFITLLQHKCTKPISRYVSMKLTSRRAHGTYPGLIPWNPFLRSIKSSTVNEEGGRQEAHASFFQVPAHAQSSCYAWRTQRIGSGVCMCVFVLVCACVCVCVHVCVCVCLCLLVRVCV